MGLPKVGAYAVVENMGGFNSSIAQVNNGIASVNQSFQKIAAVNFDPVAKRFREISSGKFVSANDVTQLSGALQNNASAFASASTKATDFFSALVKWDIIKKAASAILDASQALLHFGISSIEAAARADEMRLVAQYMGATIGISSDEINGMIDTMKGLGIEEAVAAKAIARLTQENLGLEHATELVRIAQASAIVSGRTSSEVLDDIIYGITSLQPRVLRTNGIMVGLNETLDELSATTGISSQELDTHSKQIAFLGDVVEKGAGLLNLYDTAMKEPMKKWRSLPRVANEIQVAIGKPFKDAFGSVVDTITYVMKGFRDALLPGGAFYDLLQRIGALTSIVFDAMGQAARSGFDMLIRAMNDTHDVISSTSAIFAKGGGEIVSEMITIRDGIITRLSDTATSAFEWGINIVANLADGIITGAANVLTGAMDFISNILFAWLAPGSPPRVAPDIDMWGAATMDEYLKGFNDADFGILDGIQAPLKQVLDIVGRSDEFSKFSISLADAIGQFEATGQISQDLYQQLASIGGVYGDELMRLVDLQFQVSAATKAAQEADNRYKSSRQRVSKLTAEYNKLLREGASEQVLKAKLAEINAAEKAADQALQDKKIADENIDTTKEQLALQEKLIANLLELAKAEKKARDEADKPEKPGKGGGEKKPTIPGLPGGVPNIAGLFDEQFDNLKKRIQEKLGDAFAPLRQRWETSIGPTLNRLMERFRRFFADVRTLVGYGLDTFRKWWSDNGPAIISMAQQMQRGIELAFGAISSAVVYVGQQLGPFIGEQLRKLSDWFIENGPLITDFGNKIADALYVAAFVFSAVFPEAVKLAWGIIAPIFDMALKNILDIGKLIMQVATGDWKGAWETMKDIAGNVWEAIQELWVNFADWVTGWFNTDWKTVYDTWVKNWDMFKTIVRQAWDAMRRSIESTWRSISSFISAKLSEIKTNVDTAFSNLKTSIEEALNGISTKVEELLGGLVTVFSEKFGEIAGIIWALIGEEGPLAMLASVFESGGLLDRAMSWFRNNVLYYFTVALNGVAAAIDAILGLIQRLKDALSSIDLPDWIRGPSARETNMGAQALGRAMPSMVTTQTTTPASMVSNSNVTLNIGRIGSDRPMSDAVTISSIRRVVARELSPNY